MIYNLFDYTVVLVSLRQEGHMWVKQTCCSYDLSAKIHVMGSCLLTCLPTCTCTPEAVNSETH